MSKQLRLEPAQLTDVGRKRPHNEDNMAYVIPKDSYVLARKGALFIVADGMGGHAAGEVASEIAVDTVSKMYYQDDSEDVRIALLRAIKRANALIYQRAAENMLRSGMGTTCVAAVLRGKTAYIANVGDSRAYLIHGGQARQISQDHSWVAEQVRAGLLTEDQARSHAQRNVITRCLGTQPDVEIDVFPVELQEGDSLVLCTDGLSGLISDEELRTIVDQHQPQESVYLLVERANENGGSDNITAIVVRVQEVGTDPPEVLHPVYAGGVGGVVGDDTLPIGQAPVTMPSMPLHIEDGRTPSAPLRYPTSPLPPPERVTAPQPVVRLPPRRRHRLFYPTLALFVLLVASLASAGSYYLFFHKDVESELRQADQLISQAKQEVSGHPVNALQKLSLAQATLRQAQESSLTDQQRQRLNALLTGPLLTTARGAIAQYNQTNKITVLPCRNTISGAVNLGSTNTQVDSLATLVDGKGNLLFYALGENQKLYQLSELGPNQHSLLHEQVPTLGTVLKIASNGSRLLALVEQPAAGGAPAKYSLHVLTPTSSGVLQDSSAFTLDARAGQAGSIPVLIAAWDTQAYIILTSTASPNTATILNVEVSMQPHNVLVMKQVSSATISISTGVISLAAFPNRQLFLLLSDGSVQSLQVVSGSQKPESIVIQEPIAPSLPVSPSEFTPQVTVPTASAGAQTPSFLNVSQATQLVVGSLQNVAHLYVVDGLYHRVLDLLVVPPASSGPPTAIPTSATSTTGGATSSGAVTVQLVRQYASASLLAHVKSVVASPKEAELYLLTRSQTLPLLSIDVSQKTPCGT